MSVFCPECDSPIDVNEFDVDIGDELTCAECGSLLRISNDSPVEVELADEDDDDLEDGLKKAEADGEDDDDDDDEDDEDDDSTDDE